MENEIKKQEIESIKSESEKYLQLAEAFIVDSYESRDFAIKEAKVQKDRIKEVKEKMEPLRKKTHEAHKATTNMINEMLNVPEKSQKLYLDKINGFNKVEHEKQVELERKAEAKRIEAERKERERLEKLAEKQMAKGKFDKAEETLERSEDVFIPAQSVQQVQTQTLSESGKVSSSSKQGYKYFIVDMDLILNAVIDRKLPVMKEKATEICLTKSDIKMNVEMNAYDDRQLKEVGLRREVDFSTKIY